VAAGFPESLCMVVILLDHLWLSIPVYAECLLLDFRLLSSIFKNFDTKSIFFSKELSLVFVISIRSLAFVLVLFNEHFPDFRVGIPVFPEI
jgi:hypothetical protein